MDPTTEIIYDADKLPTDQKILDRLKELDSEKEKIENFSAELDKNSNGMLEFL